MKYIKLHTCLIFLIFLSAGILNAQRSVAPLFVRDTLHQLPELDDVYGVVFDDIDGDHYPDLFLVRFRNLNRFFILDPGHHVFKDKTIDSRLGGNIFPGHERNLDLGVSAVDWNNDGLKDLAVFGWDDAWNIYQQISRGVFQEVRFTRHLNSLDLNHGVWSDINKDGYLDLLVTNEHGPNKLYLQINGHHFKDASSDYGISPDSTVSQGALFADLNMDGFDDLIICNWFSPDECYVNMEGKQFRRLTLSLPHFEESYMSNSVSIIDFDNDGDPDIIICDRTKHTLLYENRTLPGSDHIIFIPRYDIGIANPYPAYGALVADFDNNGWQDILFTNIGPNLFFLNNNGIFTLAQKWEDHSGLSVYSTGASCADVDGDGDLDVFIANKDTASFLYLNNSMSKANISIQLEGVESNRNAIGSKVFIYKPLNNDSLQLVQFRQLVSANGYLSSSWQTLYFYVDSNQSYSVRVQFPSGKERWLKNIELPLSTKISEETGILASIKLWMATIKGKLYHPKFLKHLIYSLLLFIVIIIFYRLIYKRYQLSPNRFFTYFASHLSSLYLIMWIFRRSEYEEVLIFQWLFSITFMSFVIVMQERLRTLIVRREATRQVLLRFSEDVIFIRDNEQLISELMNSLTKFYHLKFCFFIFVKPEPKIGKSIPAELNLNVSIQSIEQLVPEVFTLPLHYHNQTTEKISRIFQLPVDTVLPVGLRDEHFGFLCIGLGENRLTSEDIKLLKILINQASIAYSYNEYVSKIREMTARMVETQTREKYISELESKNQELQKLYRELQATQAQAIQNEKMVSLGQLVAGIAHELNNPISFIYANLKELQKISDFITSLLEKLKTELIELSDEEKKELEYIYEELPKLLEENLEGSQRVKNIVETLRQFSREEKGEMGEVDIIRGLESSLLLLKNEWKNRITLHKNYNVRPIIEGNQNELNQVFLNILHNAILAIPEKGDITISVEAMNEDAIKIQIQDNGVGIPQELINRIFDPFFTTRPVGKGTGLGLSISYSIVQKHNGSIEVESEPGKGTIFTIILPVKQRKVQHEQGINS